MTSPSPPAWAAYICRDLVTFASCLPLDAMAADAGEFPSGYLSTALSDMLVSRTLFLRAQ
jgi:hypothetical protein